MKLTDIRCKVRIKYFQITKNEKQSLEAEYMDLVKALDSENNTLPTCKITLLILR